MTSPKWMPKKPRFDCLPLSVGAFITKDNFDYWFDSTIKPIFESAIEVERRIEQVYHPISEEAYPKFMLVDKPHCTHRALLINIEPIKKDENAEHLIRLAVDAFERRDWAFLGPCIERIKQHLERHK